MNGYLIAILIILTGNYLLYLIIENCNLKNISTDLPEEFKDYYDAEKYRKSQNYLRENTGFGIFSETIFLLITIIFILFGGFNLIDQFVRGYGYGPIVSGLIFALILMFFVQLLHLPFKVYEIFIIEEKYGFNRTTVKTFILDILKGWFLTVLIGCPVFAGILWFFDKTGQMAWVWCWLGLTLFRVFLMFIAPVVIMPLFNKFIPLEEGDLKKAIEDYACSQNFKMKGVFKMDGSKRSTKSNAFFTGFGKFRRIVLFDTLIERHSIDGLVSVLGHEIGHYKKKHIFQGMLISIITTGWMFFILSFFINNPGLFTAFKMQHISIYASLFFFGFLYTPINLIMSLLGSALSRKNEYEADAYAALTYKKPEAMIEALKKLSVDNLSNLTPHSLKVFFEYSHPPVLDRIKAIKQMQI